MKTPFGVAAFIVCLGLIAAFVWISSADLPPMVASHFVGSGAANGFMPCSAYRAVMLLTAVGAPLLVALLPLAYTSKDSGRLNLPNRDYWLAAEHREETLMFLRLHGLWFAVAVALFLAYVHGLVVQANQMQPPVLASSAMTAGLVTFFAALAVWLLALYWRFRKPHCRQGRF